MAGKALLSIEGNVAELQASIKASEVKLGKEQRKGNKAVASFVAAKAQANARAGTRAEARYALAIRPASTLKMARLRLQSTGRNAGANPTFWGQKKRTGWYAQPKYADSTGQQSPKWVGNTGWIAGRKPGGPYVLNETVADNLPEIEDMYLDAYEQALLNTFSRKAA